MSTWIGIGLLIVAAAALILTDNPGQLVGLSNDDFGRLVGGVALITVIGSSVLFSYRGRASLAIKQALSWVAFGLFLVAVYSYRAEFMGLGSRMVGELVPGMAVGVTQTDRTDGGRKAVAVTANERGQFNVDALLNGTHVRLIADTGATLVVLTYEDAQRIGIDVKNLDYRIPVNTANGRTFNARIKIDTLTIGAVRADNVDALVSKSGRLHRSLLGMSFLQAISSFEISGNRLILRQ